MWGHNMKAVAMFSHSVMSHSLQSHGLQHARLPCPSLSPRVFSNPCPLIQWCYLTVSSSGVPFSSCLQSFRIRVFFIGSALHIRWPKYWSFSISPSNEYSGLISFRIDWFDLLAIQETIKSLLSTTIWKYQFFSIQPSLWPMSRCVLSRFSHVWLFATPWTITHDLWMATFSFGEGNGNPLQDSCLVYPMDRGAWQAIIHGIAKSQT